MTAQLVLQFRGAVVIRIPTDPDPTDEPRGISGYTFAFGDEPDLDRILQMQPRPDLRVRSHAPPIGVTVHSAQRLDQSGARPVPALVGARVELLDEPRFENRNWTLTLPGHEPVVPFKLRVSKDRFTVQREDLLDPKAPGQPFWMASDENLARRGARGMEYEPETVGNATGIWDSLAVAVDRRTKLAADLARLSAKDSAEAAIVRARIAQLDFAIANPSDRRLRARWFVERFAFDMNGPDASVMTDAVTAGGDIDPITPWPVSFWLGGWDPDLLCAYMQGSLTLPYRSNHV